MTDETVSDLSYADTLWKAADALHGKVEVRECYAHRVGNYFCESGGIVLQSRMLVEAHGSNRTDVSVFGQKSNPTMWRLDHINLATRGNKANLGPAPDYTFIRPQHPDLKADLVFIKPPYNANRVDRERLKDCLTMLRELVTARGRLCKPEIIK
jgi:type I restriction-modification system DNA methylase subunit